MSLEALSSAIAAARGADILASDIAFGELTVTVKLSSLVDVIAWLRTDPACRFSTLVDITAVDWPERAERFDVVYHFLSMYTNTRIRLKAVVAEGAMVPTLTVIHPTANWFEREVFDMFGIIFAGHPEMRRILTDYGFPRLSVAQGFPDDGLHRGPL